MPCNILSAQNQTNNNNNMPNETTTTTTPTAPANPPGTNPSPLNEAQLTSLTKTEEICRAALKPEYLNALITLDEGEQPGEDDVSESAIKAVLTLCEAARGKGSDAVSATGFKQQSTAEEENAEKALVALVRVFQARARQKHFFTSPDTLATYGIGQNIDVSRSVLEGWAETVYNNTATDKLPKVTAAKRAELKQALDAYKASQTGQSGAIGEAGGHRIDRDALVNQATARRMWLQFAADAEWPHTDPANYPIRREFQLPANRAFIG
jgi:hypothetical protein